MEVLSDYSEYSETESEYENEDDLMCTNLDPILAKLMGIIVDDNIIDNEVWVPPSTHGLSNSESLINDDYTYFQNIKENIIKGNKLSNNEIEYIKTSTNKEKMEIIELYNNISSVINNNYEK
ncbi:hypothetical protein CL656_00045 [bacterium]|nr:hypothetical protein [bacterium]|tara:strand:+ start:1704 stop:2069 length:366 start_codon:yes stop_codon:yes gene_type:complete